MTADADPSGNVLARSAGAVHDGVIAPWNNGVFADGYFEWRHTPDWPGIAILQKRTTMNKKPNITLIVNDKKTYATALAFLVGLGYKETGFGAYVARKQGYNLCGKDDGFITRGTIAFALPGGCVSADRGYIVVDLRTQEPASVKLNAEYTAVVGDGVVEVGCQKISFSKVRELAEAIKS
jgi:hypothetical protein